MGTESSAAVAPAQPIPANNSSHYFFHHLSVSAHNMREDTMSLPKSETTPAEAAMLLTPSEEQELLAVKAHLHDAYFRMRTASHQWHEARHLLHVILERLDEVEQKAARLRCTLQKRNA
jgi:hypothetical protein